jgi:hypothetical protein
VKYTIQGTEQTGADTVQPDRRWYTLYTVLSRQEVVILHTVQSRQKVKFPILALADRRWYI